MADATSQETPPKQLRIKKYPNRRYYDATHSRHVTLEEIYNLIRQGYEVQATDSKTGQDITAKVLAQIIIELDTPKLGVFPVPMLHRLLRSNERLVGDFVDKYFNQPLTQFLDSQRSMERYFRQAVGLHTPAPTVADWAKMMWGPFNPSLWPTTSTNGTKEPPVPPDPEKGGGRTSSPREDESDLRSLVNELRREIAELRGERRRPGSPPRAKRKSR